jgi:DNA-binding NarL/FixJ family response regulator
MPGHLEALVVDDDVWSLRLIKGLLRECFPELRVETRTEPDCEGEYDIFFVDDDFHGTRVAADLARQIRTQNPEALVIAYSANLDASTLKSLINAGCNGACDKSVSSDLPHAIEIVRAFIESKRVTDLPARTSFVETVRSVRDLIREWNSRLEAEDRNAAEAAEAAS